MDEHPPSDLDEQIPSDLDEQRRRDLEILEHKLNELFDHAEARLAEFYRLHNAHLAAKKAREEAVVAP